MRTFRDGAIAPPMSDNVHVRVLAASTAETHTIPAGANYVNFTADGDFYAKIDTAANITASPATVPSGDVTDGTASTLNPGTRQITGGADRISLIAGGARVITMEFWG